MIPIKVPALERFTGIIVFAYQKDKTILGKTTQNGRVNQGNEMENKENRNRIISFVGISEEKNPRNLLFKFNIEKHYYLGFAYPYRTAS